MISFDPEQMPPLDEEARAAAQRAGMLPLLVECYEQGDIGGTDGAGKFWAFGSFVPRRGELLVLQNNSVYEMSQIGHRVVKRGNLITMVTTLVTERRPSDEGE